MNQKPTDELKELIASMRKELKDSNDIKNLFGIQEENLLQWLRDFSDYFSDQAKKDKPLFNRNDVILLIIMNTTEDYEDIEHYINSQDYRQLAADEYMLIFPFYKEAGDIENADEIAENLHSLEVSNPDSILTHARIYKRATLELLTIVKDERKDPDYYLKENRLIYSVIYLFRHTLELYLKSVAQRMNVPRKHKHSFKEIIESIEKDTNQKFHLWVKNQLLYFDSFDQEGTTFKYPHERNFYEYVIDLYQLEYIINNLCDYFEGSLNYDGKTNSVSHISNKPRLLKSQKNINTESIKRLKELMREFSLENSELIIECDVAETELNKIIRNKENDIPKAILYYLAYKYKVNPVWIIDGNEPKFIS